MPDEGGRGVEVRSDAAWGEAVMRRGVMLVLGVPHQWNLPLLSSVGSMESGCQDVTRLVGMSLGSWQQGSECSFIILPPSPIGQELLSADHQDHAAWSATLACGVWKLFSQAPLPAPLQAP